jgi:putative ABC transport system permease protein
MRPGDLAAKAVRNTFRSRLRTTLTVLALFVGAFTLTLTTAVGAGVTDYVTKQVASLGADDVLIVTRAAPATDGPTPYDPETSAASTGATAPALPGAGESDPLTEDDLEELADVAGILRVEPIQLAAVDFVEYDGGDRYEFTINPTSSVTRSDLVAGDQLDNAASRGELVLPMDYLEPLGFDDAESAVGGSVLLGVTDVLGDQHTVRATVVGVARTSLLASGSAANSALVADLVEAQAAGIDAGPSRYAIAVAWFDPSLSAAAVSELKADLVDAGYGAQTIQDQLGVITTVIAGIVGVLNAFAVVALIAAAFGIVNTLLMSVQERTREIGLMKAMGMRSGAVFTLFSLEAIVIGFLGSVIGAGSAILLGTALSGALAAGPLAELPGLTILLFEPASVAGIVLLIVAIAFLSGTLPARRAARKDPIESLRYE